MECRGLDRLPVASEAWQAGYLRSLSARSGRYMTVAGSEGRLGSRVHTGGRCGRVDGAVGSDTSRSAESRA